MSLNLKYKVVFLTQYILKSNSFAFEHRKERCEGWVGRVISLMMDIKENIVFSLR